jgi:hypothetical protein
MHPETAVNNIANRMVEQGLDVINAWQMTTKSRIGKEKYNPEISHFICNLSRAVKSQEIFKTVNFCHTLMKTDAYKHPEWPDVMLKIRAIWPYLGNLQAAISLLVLYARSHAEEVPRKI